MATHSHFLLQALAVLSILLAATAQTIVNPTTAAPSATIVASASGYAYAGCWNETVHVPGTDGARALSDGNSSANNTMTIQSCLSYCAPSQYAGLEYGRECYCGEYLSPFSHELDDKERCVFACDGNGSEVCGGSLALTLYNRTASSAGVARRVGGAMGWSGMAWVGLGLVVFGVVL